MSEAPADIDLEARRAAYLEQVADDALALEDATEEQRAAMEQATQEAAERRVMLEQTVERLSLERGDAVGRAEEACRSMVTAFADILSLNDDLRAAVTQLGDGAPMSPIETERRLSLMLAAQLATISRSSGPTFGGLKYFWTPYPAADVWPRSLSMKEKAHDKQTGTEPTSEGPDGSHLPPYGVDLAGHADTGLGDGDAGSFRPDAAPA